MTRSLIVSIALLAVAVGAQEERVIDNFGGLGVRAMGMGGAYAGVADDFTAVFWNPAGLAQIQRREVYVGLLRNSKENVATVGHGSPLAASATADVSNTRFGSLGFVYPVPVYRGALVLAAGFNRVKDFDWGLTLPTIPVRRDASNNVIGDSLAFEDSFVHEGGMSVLSMAAAVDVSPTMSVGLTLNLISGEDKTEMTFSSLDTEDLFLERRFLTRLIDTDLNPGTAVGTEGLLCTCIGLFPLRGLVALYFLTSTDLAYCLHIHFVDPLLAGVTLRAVTLLCAATIHGLGDDRLDARAQIVCVHSL